MNTTLPERFWTKVDMGGDCWLWTGACDSAGYGSFRVAGRTLLSHRLAWIEVYGEIPKGLQLDHLCRVRNCVNPAHMEVVTNRENSLRGQSPAAAYAARTHCLHGHEYDAENTRMRGTKRICRACDAARQRAYQARKRAKA